MADTFNYGLLQFDKTAQPLTTKQQELNAAFAYFNAYVNREALQSLFKEAETKIKDGRHPVGEQSFVKVGSLMAAKLREKYGPERLRTYHTTGAIPFFSDYVAMYKADPTYPKELRFNDSFERMIAKWNDDWKKTWTAEIRALHVNFTGQSEAIDKLKAAFAGAEVFRTSSRNSSNMPRGGWKSSRRQSSRRPLSYTDRTLGGYAITCSLTAAKRPEARASSMERRCPEF